MLWVELGMQLTYLAIRRVIAVTSRISVAYTWDVPRPEARHTILSTRRGDFDHLRVRIAIVRGNKREALNREERDNREQLHGVRECV